MVSIIQFPKKVNRRDEALRALARKIMQHLTVAMYDRGILDIPAQAFVDGMCRNLLDDEIDYDPEIIEGIGNNMEMLVRFERLFIATLVENGYVSPDKA